jgi:hypothetical protein
VRRNVGAHDPQLSQRSRLLIAGQGLSATSQDRDDTLAVKRGGTVVHDDGREKRGKLESHIVLR